MMMFTMAAFAQMMAVLVPCQYPGLACSTACYHFGCGCSLLGPALVLFVLFAWSLRHGPRGLSFFSQFAVWSFLWGLRDVLFSNAWAMRSREAQVRPLGQASLGAGDGSSSPGEYVWLYVAWLLLVCASGMAYLRVFLESMTWSGVYRALRSLLMYTSILWAATVIVRCTCGHLSEPGPGSTYSAEAGPSSPLPPSSVFPWRTIRLWIGNACVCTPSQFMLVLILHTCYK